MFSATKGSELALRVALPSAKTTVVRTALLSESPTGDARNPESGG